MRRACEIKEQLKAGRLFCLIVAPQTKGGQQIQICNTPVTSLAHNGRSSEQTGAIITTKLQRLIVC